MTIDGGASNTQPDSSVLIIRTLGTFSVSIDGNTLSNNSSRAQQVWKLFKYIVTNRTKPIPVDRLVDMLWPEGNVDNPVKALYSLMHRLRTIMKKGGAGDHDYILFQHNSYVWNSKVPYFLDAQRFEACCQRAKNKDISVSERIGDYNEALSLYDGDFLAESSLEDWVLPWANYYKRMYTAAAADLCSLYRQEGHYELIVRVCEQAIERDPYEEALHEELIAALIKLGQYAQAATHYDYITNLLYKELSVQPSERLQELYHAIHPNSQDIQFDMSFIKNTLRESDDTQGAFYCDLDTFRYLYRLEVRSMMRSGQAVFLSLLTLTTPDHRIPDGRVLSEAMTLLKDIAVGSLRRGDVVSRYSRAQIIFLLPTQTIDDAHFVLGRIKKQFMRQYSQGKLTVHISVEPVEARLL